MFPQPDFLRYIWLFFIITHERVKAVSSPLISGYYKTYYKYYYGYAKRTRKRYRMKDKKSLQDKTSVIENFAGTEITVQKTTFSIH